MSAPWIRPGASGAAPSGLADVLAAIRRERPGARIVLLGHSAGGALAVPYAGGGARQPVDGYVLLAPYLGLVVNARTAEEIAAWLRRLP